MLRKSRFAHLIAKSAILVRLGIDRAVREVQDCNLFYFAFLLSKVITENGLNYVCDSSLLRVCVSA